MVDELHLDDKKRHTNFHHNDSLISVEDLWNSWTRSEGNCFQLYGLIFFANNK